MLQSLDHRGAGRFLKRIGHIVRMLLLFVSLFGLLAAWFWVYQPKRVVKLDDKIKARHLEPYQDRLRAAQTLMAEGSPDGRTSLEALLHDMDGVRKGDRLNQIKENCFLELEKAYQLPADSAQLIALYENWAAFNDRDLRPQVGLAKVQLTLPEFKEQGMATLTDLFNRIPDAPLIADAYGSIILEKGSAAEYFGHFLRQREELRQNAIANDWYFYWNTGKGFQRNGRSLAEMKWLDETQIEVSCKLPAASYWAIRLDSPPWLPICLINPVFSLTDGKNQIQAPLAETTQRLNDVELRSGMYFAGQGDPYMTSLLPTVTALGANGKATFRAALLPGSFEKLAEMLPTPEARQELIQQLNDQDRRVLTELEPYFPDDRQAEDKK